MNINFKYYCHKYIYEIKIKTDLYYYLLYFVTFGKIKNREQLKTNYSEEELIVLLREKKRNGFSSFV
ncbi:hypothetical protein C7E23_09445 [Elizabethkingia anophelis]|nr:hypothetical protein C7E23_09445 [Elizabethkingia anophelis]